MSQQAIQETTPDVVMLQMISGFWVSRAIYIAAKLGIADLLGERPQTADELAAATETHAPSLYRVLRALASVGVFTMDENNRFALTPVGATLRTDIPGTLRFFAMTELGEEHYPAWGNLMHSVRTGEIAFDNLFGMPVWEFFSKNPENARIFNAAMTTLTEWVEAAILQTYDFSTIGKIVDVGGGHGGFISAILKANPGMKGVLFDQPHVVDGASETIEKAGLADRCEIVGGSFFDAVPEGGDAYILKWIIHDWDDERSIAILRNCRRAMLQTGRLLLVETVVPPGNEPSFAKFIDLNMLVMTGGRERTEAEYRALFEAAGFRLTRIVPTPSPMFVIEGVPA
ncbi:MAG TPA: methyltransferase [Blastocatellia bacterium]|nr:methyltransferase [Blastocatellia bacterium]